MSNANKMKTLNGYEVCDAAARAQINGVTTSGTGEAYTATVDGIEELVPGVSFVMIPHTDATSTVPTLNVNGLGACPIKHRLSNSTKTTTLDFVPNWIKKDCPIRVTYNEIANGVRPWVIEAVIPDLGSGVYGTLPIEHGGTGATTIAAARNNLGLGNTSGALPVENGGTGCTSLAAAKKLFSVADDNGTIGIANGGTGATTAAAARANLDITLSNLGITISSTAAPATGTANTIYLQMIQDGW